MSAEQKTKSGKRKAPGKHHARIAAIQALYQMEISSRGAAGVIQEFLEQRFETPSESLPEGEVDKPFFVRLVEQVVKNQDQIDQAIRHRLSGNWRLSRIDRTLRAILRCGSYELLVDSTAPRAVIIDEYVEITGAFFDKSEVGFINATLDSIAKGELPINMKQCKDAE